MMKAAPAASFIMIEPKFLLEILITLPFQTFDMNRNIPSLSVG